MTSFSIDANSVGDQHRHAAVKPVPRHRRPKHAEPRHVTRVAREKPLAAMLLATAAAAAVMVAVVATVALWTPTFSASPIVALDSYSGADTDTAADTGTALGGNNGVVDGDGVAPEVPTLAPDTAGDEQVTAARTFAGTQLAANAGLELSTTARELLVDGRVDARGILSLGQYLGQTQLSVADFPALDAATAAGGVRRQILVSGLSGVALGADASTADRAASEGAAASVVAWFEALSAPVDVESVARTPAGVLVTFGPGEPSSILPTPAPSP